MRLTSFSVIFAIILAMIFSVSGFEIRRLKQAEYLEIYNKKILEHASSDACSTLKKSALVYGGSIVVSSEIEAENVFESFFKSLSLSLGISDKGEKENLKKYFPLLCIIENNGITLSSYVEIKNSEGIFLKRVILPKFRFFIEDDGTLYYPTLSGEVTAVYEENGTLREESGTPQNLLERGGRDKDLSLLKQENVEELLYHQIQEQIVMLINEEIERHEIEMAKQGLYYDFSLPNKVLDNSFEITSPCFLVIMQGYPLSLGKRSNTMNITKMDIREQGFFAGFIENGVKYYLPLSDPHLKSKELLEAFTDEFSALKSGYYGYR